MRYIKLLRIAFVSCFMLMLAAEVYFGDYLISNRNTTASKTYNIPFDAHGPPVFISTWDYNLYFGLFYSKFVLFAVGVVLYLIGKYRKP